MAGQVYLRSYLTPLEPFFDDPAVTDILVNCAGEVWIERSGEVMERHEVPGLTEQVLSRLARQIAAASHQGISREHPLISASLADGARVQIVAPPATRHGIALGIRRHGMTDLSLDRLADAGMFAAHGDPDGGARDAALDQIRLSGDWQRFLTAAVAARKTLVLSGGTSSGKTTLLNALVKTIPPRERLIVIEDAPEIMLDQPNTLGLIAARGEMGEAKVDAEDLLQASLRLRPDRILLGELRGKEAFSFLRAVNTGHPGSITTIHADDPNGAIDQITMLALLGGLAFEWEAIRRYALNVIDYVVQIRRDGKGRRVISEISETSELATGRTAAFGIDD
jgi:type IV secretion system protein VirB11